jgi:hypothetical protein
MMIDAPESNRIAGWLRKHGLHEIALHVLDLAGPFQYLGAQAMYMLEPFFGGKVNFAHDLAIILEDGEKVDALVEKLRERENKDD